MSPNAIFLKMLIEFLRLQLVLGIFFMMMFKLVSQEQLTDLLRNHFGDYLLNRILVGIGLAIIPSAFISFVQWMFLHFVAGLKNSFGVIFRKEATFFSVCTLVALGTDLYVTFASI